MAAKQLQSSSVQLEQKNNNSSSATLQSSIKSDKIFSIEIHYIFLPKVGGGIKSTYDKFDVSAVNSLTNYSVPLPSSPEREFRVSHSVSNNSFGGNEFSGNGSSLSLPSHPP